ncbi:MAG: hypothetical protein RSB96_03890 [Oscillospiraceae bacterium]
MKIRFSSTKLKGSVDAPPSKSMVHRAILCSAFCENPTTVFPVHLSKDCLATIGAIKSLGASVSVYADTIMITPICTLPSSTIIDCNESGSTFRFLLPIAYALGIQTKFLVMPSLAQRPISHLTNLLISNGAIYEDFTIKGKLTSGCFSITGDVSSQYITGLLFALSLLKQPSTLIVTSPLQSQGYVDLTLWVLRQFGINIQVILPTPTDTFCVKYTVHAKETLGYTSPLTLKIESDFSNLAFW